MYVWINSVFIIHVLQEICFDLFWSATIDFRILLILRRAHHRSSLFSMCWIELNTGILLDLWLLFPIIRHLLTLSDRKIHMHVVFVALHGLSSAWVSHHGNTILSEWILLIFLLDHIAASCSKWYILTSGIELRYAILGRFRQIGRNYALIELEISIIGFIHFVVVISYEDNSYILLIWSQFRRFLMLKSAHTSNHLMAYVSWKLIGWTLIGVSDSFILSITVNITHSVIMMVLCHSYVSITLWLVTIVVFIFIMSLILSSHTNSLKHCVSILICNCIFCSLELLIFDEISMASVYLDIWAVVSSMCWYLLSVLLSVGRYQLLVLFTFWLPGACNENNVALVDPSIIWAAVRSLFIVPSVVCSIPFVLDSNWIPTHVLWGLVEIEETWSIAFLLACSRCDVSKLMWIGFVVAASVSQEWIIIGIEFQLFCKLLLRHVQSLMMKTSLVCTSSEICWQMVLDIDDLSHVFDSIANSLIVSLISSIGWSELLDALSKVLVLWCWTFHCVKTELILIGSATDAPFVDYALINWLLSTLAMMLILVVFVISILHNLGRIPELIEVTVIDGLWLRALSCCCRRLHLGIVSTCLWSSFYLILDLLGLLLVGITNLDPLAYLLVVRSVQWMHLMVVGLHNHSSFIWRVLSIILVDGWIAHAVTRASFSCSITVSTLCCRNSSLILLNIG